jgi:LacI family transcriptional regulator
VHYTGGVVSGRAPTRDDVARQAGVSVATVSYVLNNGPRGVSDDKRRRVLDAVAALGYRPNAIARSLRARRTHILGLVLPNSADPYYAALAHAVQEAAARRGYQVVVANAADHPEREATQIEALLRLQVDGLLWVPAHLGSGAGRPAPEIPTVQLGAGALAAGGDQRRYDVIGSDNAGGGRLAADHLVGLGHRRLAFIAGPEGHLHADARLAGVRSRLAEAGLDLEAHVVARCAFDYASGAAAAARWLALPAAARPTAVVAGNDAMAIGVLHAAAEREVRVPDHLSVVGYDDVPQAAYTVPALTTVQQPLAEMGAAAVERLLTRIEAPGAAPPLRHQVLPVRLVVRHSTAAAPVLHG